MMGPQKGGGDLAHCSSFHSQYISDMMRWADTTTAKGQCMFSRHVNTATHDTFCYERHGGARAGKDIMSCLCVGPTHKQHGTHTY